MWARRAQQWPERTFVAVDKGILDNHGAAVGSGELLGLAARLPEAAGILDLVVGADAAGDAQHMAGQEVFRAAEVGIRGVRVFVAGGEEDLGGGDQEDLVDVASARGHARWGGGRREAGHTWCCGGEHWLGSALRKKARRKGFSTGGIQPE